MSYDYTDGDGLAVLDSATPNGAVEPVSNLDDAIRQIKAYLKDSTSGVQALTTNASPVKVIVSMSAVQAFASGAAAALVLFDTEALDNAGTFNPTTHTFTALSAGLYEVNVALNLTVTASAAPTDVRCLLTVAVNGTTGARAIHSFDASVLGKQITLKRKFNLSAGQTLTVKLQVTVASNSITYQATTDATESVLEIIRLSS